MQSARDGSFKKFLQISSELLLNFWIDIIRILLDIFNSLLSNPFFPSGKLTFHWVAKFYVWRLHLRQQWRAIFFLPFFFELLCSFFVNSGRASAAKKVKGKREREQPCWQLRAAVQNKCLLSFLSTTPFLMLLFLSFSLIGQVIPQTSCQKGGK